MSQAEVPRRPSSATDVARAFADAASQDWRRAFHDPGEGDWSLRWLLDGKTAQVAYIDKDLDFAAGPNAGDDASHAVLWTKQTFARDVKVEYEFTRLDDATKYVNILYLLATGVGDDPYARDIAAWADLRRVSAMPLYYRHMHLLHISYAASSVADGGTQNYIRARRYPSAPDADFPEFARTTRLDPEYENVGFFQTGVPHRVTCIKRGQDLFFRVASPAAERVFWFDLSPYPPVTSGRIGLRQMCTRHSRYRDFTVYTLPQSEEP